MSAPTGESRSEFCRRLSLLIVALLISVSLYYESRPSKKTAPAAFPVSSASHRIIGVYGDVENPGIYKVADNILTAAAIQLATPVTVIKSLLPKGIEQVSLSHGDQVTITFKSGGEATVQVKSLPVSQRILLGIPLNINRMNTDDFITLPGIGPALAERIIVYRQNNGGFMEIDDLLAVEGIGDKKYKQLKKYFKPLF